MQLRLCAYNYSPLGNVYRTWWKVNVEGRQIQGLAVAAAERCPNLAGCATGAMALGTGDPTEQYFKPIFRVHLVTAFRINEVGMKS